MKLNDKLSFWLFKGNNFEIVTNSVAFIVTLVIAIAVTTVAYWISGGEFKRGPALSIYVMLCLYLLCLNFGIARKKYQEDVRRKNEESFFEV